MGILKFTLKSGETCRNLIFACVLFLSPWSVFSADYKGKVVDAFQQPVPEATIRLATGRTILSDKDGYFELVSQSESLEVQVSAEGYRERRLTVDAGSSFIYVELKCAGASDVELPIRSVSAARFDGAAEVLQLKNLSDGSADNVAKLLAGRLAGVAVSAGNAVPDISGVSLRVRGASPLIVVDGRIGAAFEDLNLDEIDKITVLKDAAATALYGIKGGAGIIHITTKRGAVSPAKVTFRSDFTYNSFTRLPEPVDAYTHARYYNEAYRNDGNTDDFYNPEDLKKYRDGSSPLTHPNVNWRDELLKKGFWRNRYHVAVRGGTPNVHYYVGVGAETRSSIFNHQEEHNYNNRNEVRTYNLTSNLDFEPWKDAVISFNATGKLFEKNYAEEIGSTTNIYKRILTLPANEFPMYYDARNAYVDQNGDKASDAGNRIVSGNNVNGNPWALLNRAGYSKQSIFRGATQVIYNQGLSFLTAGLSFRGEVYYHIGVSENLERMVSYATYELMEDGTLYKRGSDQTMKNVLAPDFTNRRFVYNLSLNYDRTFDRHAVSASMFWNRFQNAARSSVPARDESLAFHAGYQYGNRYSVNVNMIYGGDYAMSVGNKYEWFPTVSLGWIVSNESFMRNAENAVSFLKLRASYGESSAGGASAFAYMDNMKRVGGVYHTGANMSAIPGLYVDNVSNFALVNGRRQNANIGLSLGLFRNSVNIGVDVYTSYEKDLAITPDASYSDVYGWVNVPKMNLGRNRTKGVDISVEYRKNYKGCSFGAGGVFSYFDKIVLENDEPANLPYEWMSRKNRSSNATMGYVAGGIIRSREELENLEAIPDFATPNIGDIWYVDLNDDGVIDKFDRKDIGYGSTPRINYGFWFDLDYKGFDISVLFEGTGQVAKMLSGMYRNPFVENTTILKSNLDAFSADNTDARFPALYTSKSSNNNQASTFWMRDASYLRLKSVTLGYSLPLRTVNMRLFVSGFNLLTFDSLDFIDPETSFDGTTLPEPRSWSFGVNITF